MHLGQRSSADSTNGLGYWSPTDVDERRGYEKVEQVSRQPFLESLAIKESREKVEWLQGIRVAAAFYCLRNAHSPPHMLPTSISLRLAGRRGSLSRSG